MKPFPFQKEVIRKIEAFNGRALCSCEMGLGKTPMSLWCLKRNPDWLPAIVVAPAFVKYVWETEAKKAIGWRSVVLEGQTPSKGKLPPNNRLTIINYDILWFWLKWLKPQGFQTVIIDECFPWETKVLTEIGWLPIGLIVDFQLPLSVASFDGSAIEFQPISRYIRKKRTNRMAILRHGSGSLLCTENHKVWVEGKGYVELRKINRGDRLRRVRNVKNSCQEGSVNSQVLQQELCLEIQQSASFGNGREKEIAEALGWFGMPTMSQDFPCPTRGCEKAKVLLSFLCGIRNGSPAMHERVSKEDKHFSEKALSNQGRESYSFQTVCSHVIEESHARPKSDRENEDYQGSQWNTAPMEGETRGQRQIYSSTVGLMESFVKRLGIGSINPDWQESPKRFDLPIQLQGRYRQPKTEDWYRSRWPWAQQSQKARVGLEKDQIVEIIRVESVEGFEPRNRPGLRGSSRFDYVYCLEVEKHHNFFADGVLVSNCQYLGNPSTKRTKAVKELCRGVPHVLGLSGTPLLNRPIELFPTLNIIAPKAFPARRVFGDDYCAPEWTAWGITYKGASNTKKLNRLLIDSCLPYESMVYSEYGPISIGKLVESNLRIRVASYDHVSSSVQWRQIQANASHPAPNKMLRIKHEFGELHCTPDHRIWTKEKEYIRADALETGFSMLVLLGNQSSNHGNQHEGGSLLLDTMCGPPSGRDRRSPEKTSAETLGTPPRFFDRETLSGMWKGVVSKWWGQNMESSKVLLNLMFQKMVVCPSKSSNETSLQNNGGEAKGHPMSCDTKKHRGSQENCGKAAWSENVQGILSNAICYPNEIVGRTKSLGENTKILENIQACQTTPCRIGLGRKVVGVFNNVKTPERPISKGAPLLCGSRYCQAISEIGNRNRWTIPQTSTSTITGSLEGKNIVESRVVSIEVYEPTNRRGPAKSHGSNKVYDIQVEGGNFFADGSLVHNCMIRKRKAEVLKELPDKMRQVVPVHIKDWHEYKRASEGFLDWLHAQDPAAAERASNAVSLTKIGHLLQLSAKLKLRSVVEWINNFLQNTDEKIVVFAEHKKMVRALKRRIEEPALVIDGSVSPKDRKGIVNQFQTQNHRVLIGSKAAGVGITLTAASTVVFTELWWRPGDHTQAEDRCHRIGAHKTVWCYYLVAKNTLEEKLCKILQEKQKVLSAVLDGGPTDESLDVFNLLCNELQKEEPSGV